MESRIIKILAIDDNRDNLISLKALIKDAFPEAVTLTAQNGIKGFELAAAENPDVILLDIVMPGMDGYEVCKKLKADTKLCDIPVVFVTAIKGDPESRIHALECGGDAFLAKPIDKSELTAQIRAMVRIKAANIVKLDEKERLESLVAEQVIEIKETQTATLNLLEEVFRENEARKITEKALQESERAFFEINECLVNLGPDYHENINALTALCGELLGATCALYNRLEGEMLCSLGQWCAPPDFNPVDKPDGHICYDVIRQGNRQVYLVRNLPETQYYESDPNVKLYKLETYAGHAVFSGDEPLGSLCVVYQHDTDLSARDTGILSIIASALASEEQRFKSRSAVEESNRKYLELSTLMRLLADNIPDMIWAKNLKKEFIFANRAICENLLNAVDTEEPLGKTDMFFANRERISQPENPQWHTFGEICRDSDSITLEEMKPMQFDEFGNVKSKFLFLEVHKAPFYDENGQLIGIVGSGRDVTAAKEAESKLRKLSQAVEQSPACVVITDLLGNIEYVNPKFSEVTGYTFEEAIGQNPRILKSGKQPETFYIDLWKTISSGREWRGELLNKKKNGELYWESALISPIMDEKGEILNYLAVKEDITERRQAEENLRLSEEKYRLLAENSADVIWMTDAKGIYSYISPAVEKLYGYKPEEAIGLSMMMAVPPEQREESAQGFQNTLQFIQSFGASIHPFTIELEQLCKDNSRIWVETLFKALFDEKDRFSGFLGITRDISERKKAMIQAQKHIDEQLLLGKVAHNLAGIESRDELYKYIAQQVHYLCSNSYIVLCYFDEEKGAFMLKSSIGLSKHLEKLQKIIGINIYKLSLPLKDIPEYQLNQFKGGKINLIEADGVHIMSGGIVSRKTGKLIEDLLGIRQTVVMGLSCNDIIYGALGCFVKSDLPVENLMLIETIVNQSALAIQRLYTGEKLKISENRYRRLVEMSPDGIGLFKLKGQLVSCNLEMARILGYKDENELLKKGFNAYNLININDQHKINKGLKLMVQGKPVPLEIYGLQRKDGSIFPAEVHSVLIQQDVGDKPLLLSIIRDATERTKAEEALARYNEQLRIFAGHNEVVREKERMNLARDIHDILGSSLAGLKMELAFLKRQLPEEILNSIPDIPRQINSMALQINDSVEVMRKIVRELRPGILDELGLIEAIKWYAGEIESRSNIICKLRAPQMELNIGKNKAVIIFRIFQEIMTNIMLHSKSTSVLISVDLHNDLLKLIVKDNGIGIEKKAIERTDSFGLLGMKERAMLLDGNLTIFGEPAKGTTVVLEVPIENKQI